MGEQNPPEKLPGLRLAAGALMVGVIFIFREGVDSVLWAGEKVGTGPRLDLMVPEGSSNLSDSGTVPALPLVWPLSPAPTRV